MSNCTLTPYVLGNYWLLLPDLLYRNPVKDWADITVARAKSRRSGLKMKYLNFEVLHARLAIQTHLYGGPDTNTSKALEKIIDCLKQLADHSISYQRFCASNPEAQWNDEESEWWLVAGQCDELFALFEYGEI